MSDDSNRDEREPELPAAADESARSPEGSQAESEPGDPSRPEPPGPSLAQTLLHQPVPRDDRPSRRWCYGPIMQIVATLFILYHGVILLVHNLPGKGLAKGAQKVLNERLDANDYWQASGNTQSWAMFAPNPHRSNIFMKVLVKDANGEVWDLKHDIYGKRTYPYLWYDRMGKINRRIIDQKGYRRHYAAWVCRQWEMDHGGDAADEVQFIKMWTRIPPPQAVFERAQGNIFKMGFDPMQLELHQREEDTISCATNRHAQLPNYLRERHGLPQMPEKYFKGQHLRTWWDIKESERQSEERKQKRAARAAARRGDPYEPPVPDDPPDDAVGVEGEAEGSPEEEVVQ
ncbi:hypothetical protein [Paraliomyxa miuraensis]|uniref:hypothetical protein n=1 Tax=Paraliomyxa miuraensis TaxID=376150 RepID=UPI002250A698|nr:hypothetical protein [Paraliomyxa miuraensis]MCX4241859.1 hypothetical protein [Paraliomyxa miuraensis]